MSSKDDFCTSNSFFCLEPTTERSQPRRRMSSDVPTLQKFGKVFQHLSRNPFAGTLST